MLSTADQSLQLNDRLAQRVRMRDAELRDQLPQLILERPLEVRVLRLFGFQSGESVGREARHRMAWSEVFERRRGGGLGALKGTLCISAANLNFRECRARHQLGRTRLGGNRRAQSLEDSGRLFLRRV